LDSGSNSIEELKKQITILTLFLEGQPRQQSRSSVLTSTPNLDCPWQRKCIWCDSVEHSWGKCPDFIEVLNAKLVSFNKAGRIKMMSTGEELPTMFNKGGMKESLKSRMAVTSADVSAIIFDDRAFASLGSYDMMTVQRELLHWIF
jgi:hypothetical protein